MDYGFDGFNSGGLNSWQSIGVFPDNSQPIGGNPLILLPDQALFTAGGKETIKTVFGFVELGLLNRQNGRNFTVAIKPFLVSPSQTHQTDSSNQGQAHLEAQADGTANLFLLVAGGIDQGQDAIGGTWLPRTGCS
jgi:hypothetical protein